MNEKGRDLISQIEREVWQYHNEVVPIGDFQEYSQYKLVRRIAMFESKVYPTGKFDTQGNYKFWFDINTPAIDSEVKNIDFDTKNVEVHSDNRLDVLPDIVVNLRLREWMRENGQAEELNSAIEEGSGWGNVVWKRVGGGYERVDLKNFYVINQTAYSLQDSAVIERHQLTQSDLRAQGGWKYINEVIEHCKSNTYAQTLETQSVETTTPFYDIYERNGEVLLSSLKEYNEEVFSEEDKKKTVLAKVIIAAVKGSGTNSINGKYILFADQISSMPYEEYHRGRYKGRWWREGLYELLFDVQVRANQVGNQLARGLEWASKVIFTDEGRLIYQNVLTDLNNGDIIQSKNLRQVEVRMQGLDQLANEWNRLIELRNETANSREVVQGITPASGTPLGTSQLLNANAGKLFDFLREKLSIPLSRIFTNWIVPKIVKELKIKDVVRLTGDSQMLKRFKELIVNGWYIENLLAIGPHTQEMAEGLKIAKLEELDKRPQLLVTAIKGYFDKYKARVSVDITGEGVNTDAEVETIVQFAGLESDPVRRSAMIELGMLRKGIDVAGLPKSPPVAMATPMPGSQQQVNA